MCQAGFENTTQSKSESENIRNKIFECLIFINAQSKY